MPDNLKRLPKYMHNRVERSAPRWAWEVIDEFLTKADVTNNPVQLAYRAMIYSCQGDEYPITPEDMKR